MRVRNGLLVMSRHWGWRVPGSNPDFTEDLHVCGPVARLIICRAPNVLALVWWGSLEGRCQLRCHPCHLSAVKVDKVHPKIVLVLLQNGTLI
ncbi:hypothetical protein AVEN_212964-1 [Araneus ventricosus]|uniref:Uncharacterized protein n=1 Tax=Araneus ventricosus TaxID=182803 RepID=A0A4Y2N476_ARAVE|nr:hypothetical protein AVEN_212964-1 [Araneus ventricosus]